MAKGKRLCSPRKNRNRCKRKGSLIKPQDCFFVYTNSDCFLNNLNAKKILAALENEKFVDFEDCLQEECAVESMADYIVTINEQI